MLYEQYKFQDQNSLFEAAEIISAETDEEYRHAAYLYFLARYIVAIYEARISRIPFQVWNEHRNALDHFMRYVTTPTKENTDHLRKMEGHIQRAILDGSKLFSYKMKQRIEKMIDEAGIDCLRMVDNGGFYGDICNLMAEAQDKFTHAKTIDSGLGKSNDADKKILSAYLAPLFDYISIEAIFKKRRADIEDAAQKVLLIKHCEANKVQKEESNKWHLKQHLAGHAVWSVIAALVGLIGYYLDNILAYFFG